jgi:hypothetical protein
MFFHTLFWCFEFTLQVEEFGHNHKGPVAKNEKVLGVIELALFSAPFHQRKLLIVHYNENWQDYTVKINSIKID